MVIYKTLNMLKQRVLLFEKLHGGRCEDVRRFCNFIINNHNKLRGGVGTPDRFPNLLDNQSNDSSDDSTMDTIKQSETKDEYKARTGKSAPNTPSPPRPPPPVNSPDSRYNTPETEPNVPTRSMMHRNVSELPQQDLFQDPEIRNTTTPTAQNIDVSPPNNDTTVRSHVPDLVQHSTTQSSFDSPQPHDPMWNSIQPHNIQNVSSSNQQLNNTDNAFPSPLRLDNEVNDESHASDGPDGINFASYVKNVKRRANQLENATDRSNVKLMKPNKTIDI